MSTAVPILTRDDWHLLTKGHGGGWAVLSLITQFDYARQQSVSGWGGGSYTFRDGRTGWYQTTKDGLLAAERTIMSHTSKPKEADQVLLWSTLKAWSQALPAEIVAQAKALAAESSEIHKDYPSHYVSIGRPFGWNMKPRASEEQITQDHVDLKAAQDARAVVRDAWCVRRAEYDARVVAFCSALAPTLLDDMVLEQRRSA